MQVKMSKQLRTVIVLYKKRQKNLVQYRCFYRAALIYICACVSSILRKCYRVFSSKLLRTLRCNIYLTQTRWKNLSSNQCVL